jgi:hypothetical protein
MKDVIDLSELIKAKISLLLLLPFWYLAIYLFNNDFYNTSDLILKVVVCLCLSIFSEVLFTVSFLLILELRNYKKEDIKNIEDFSTVNLILWLSFLIFISYTLQHYTDYYTPFYLLILLSQIPSLFVFFLVLLYKKVITLKEK